MRTYVQERKANKNVAKYDANFSHAAQDVFGSSLTSSGSRKYVLGLNRGCPASVTLNQRTTRGYAASANTMIVADKAIQ